MPGQLFLVGTPIGNLGDITLRAIETLKEVDVVACEDTRQTDKLLRHLGLQKTTLRYDEHTHLRQSAVIRDLLSRGKNVALVTDAGTPGISDPGCRLVTEARLDGIRVVPIPGPSSVVAALSGSGFGITGFVFLGFLPRRRGRAKRALQEALGLGKTVAVFESPFRLDDTLELIEELSGDSQVIVARELTKIHEEFLSGNAKEVRNQLKSRPQKGEAVMLIEPREESPNETEKD